jgi:hypothetical protein
MPAGPVAQIENGFSFPLFQQFDDAGHIGMGFVKEPALFFENIIPGIGFNIQFILQLMQVILNQKT